MEERKFLPVPPIPDFVKIEHKILKFWQKNNFLKKLMEKNKGKKKFSFLDGPITANNPMGVHHAWGRTYKDVVQRYKAQKGFDQRFQNGFDCQGLWVEVEVEKELGFKSKRDIEKFGIDKFVEKCKERVLKYSKIQTEQSIRLGQWMDWENSYYTMSDENNYTIWYFLKKCHEHGWIYKGEDVVPWCPRCGTAISQHEIVTEGYKELTHPGLYLQFPLKEKERHNLLVWTTTPWTLTANVACAVHPDLVYVLIKHNDQFYYLLKDRLNVIEGKYEIVKEILGKEMLNWEYEGPFNFLPVQKGVKHIVIPWEGVSAEEGTGIVHIAPGCGREDFLLGKEFSLKVISPIDEEGNFLDNYDILSKKNTKESEEIIFELLKKENKLYKIEKYVHRYPVCWRCGVELVFRLVPEWYISMKELRYKIMEVAKQVQWIPSFGLERELDWLRNMEDWLISKKRYWGLALPIYECECGFFDVIGSKEELKERAVEGYEKFEGHSPHRPWIDYVKIKCLKCGNIVNRIPDVGNPWLDAGIVPFSTLNYLKDRKYWEEWYPFDFAVECFPGQFRNWFYAILAMATVLENSPPVKTIFGYALVKDEKGEDMHKSKGNVIWFDEAAEKMGADIMRWIFVSHNPFENLFFGYKLGQETKRKLLTLWNCYSFFITYARIDNFDPKRKECQVALENVKNLLDKWLLSITNNLIKNVDKAYNNYEFNKVPRLIEEYIENLSNWYIRRSRRRFWKSQLDYEKWSAYNTLYYALTTLIKLIAPIMPFLSEEMYQNLVVRVDEEAWRSIHLNDFPEVQEELIDKDIEERMELCRKLVFLGRAAREKAKIKIRQPLRKIIFLNIPDKEKLEDLVSLIIDELNIKEVIFNEEKYIEKNFVRVEEDNLIAFLDISLDEDLLWEGFLREFIHHIQILRKEAGFEITDRIILGYKGEKKIEEVIKKNMEYIKNEILAEEIKEEILEIKDIERKIKIKDYEILVSLKRK
ncbi:MAG: isoleucine--tRNA ligase [candidate division WOR-3 bacterium]|nr:isoleucine--tRNA ligase [candidate division WOR-3 bacterium]